MNRGRRSENIFSDEKDYILFAELLKETSEICNDSTVSSVIERMKKKLAGDRKFALQLDQLAESTVTS